MRRKICSMLVVVLIVPILIIVMLNMLNWISYKCNIDINPIGVSNVEWVLFWGAYLGGVCTLIAVYYTITQNQKTFIYQYKMQAITKEKEIISHVLISLRILPIFNVLNIATNSALDDKQVGSILKYTTDTQDNLDAGMVKLSFETSIYHDLCKICKH